MGLIYVVQESAIGVPRLTLAVRDPSPFGLIKIGHTKGPLTERLKRLATSVRRSLSLIGTVEGTCSEECALHRRFTPYRADAGWGLEWYHPTADLRAAVAALLARDVVPAREPDVVSV